MKYNIFKSVSFQKTLIELKLEQILGCAHLIHNNIDDGDLPFHSYPSSNLLRMHSGLSTDLAFRPDKISQIISNRRFTFSGNSATLSVDSFLYRIKALTNQTLGGNFELLCRNASVPLDGNASDWFWRYRESVWGL